jgi:hypothetical protein
MGFSSSILFMSRSTQLFKNLKQSPHGEGYEQRASGVRHDFFAQIVTNQIPGQNR